MREITIDEQIREIEDKIEFKKCFNFSTQIPVYKAILDTLKQVKQREGKCRWIKTNCGYKVGCMDGFKSKKQAKWLDYCCGSCGKEIQWQEK